MMIQKKTHTKNKQSGMTFLEVIVVLGIFSALSAVVLFNYRDFSSSTRLHNLGQEIALQGKRAQTLASQGRRPVLTTFQAQDTLPNDWVSSYGLAFNRTYNSGKSFFFYFNRFPSNVSDPQARRLYFHDMVDSEYTTGSCGNSEQSECLEEFVISDGSYIDLICIDSEPVDGKNCEGGTPVQQMHVSFTRPLLDAYILHDANGFNERAQYGFLKIKNNSDGQERFITFYTVGQISVE